MLALLTPIVVVCIPRLDLALHERLIELDDLECDIEFLLLLHHHSTIWLKLLVVGAAAIILPDVLLEAITIECALCVLAHLEFGDAPLIVNGGLDFWVIVREKCTKVPDFPLILEVSFVTATCLILQNLDCLVTFLDA